MLYVVAQVAQARRVEPIFPRRSIQGVARANSCIVTTPTKRAKVTTLQTTSPTHKKAMVVTRDNRAESMLSNRPHFLVSMEKRPSTEDGNVSGMRTGIDPRPFARGFGAAAHRAQAAISHRAGKHEHQRVARDEVGELIHLLAEVEVHESRVHYVLDNNAIIRHIWSCCLRFLEGGPS